MSDTGRRSLTDKAGAALKPQSDKSAGQKVGDTFSSNSNHNDDSLLTKAKNAVGMGEKK
ncbi:hypothetical protein B0H14DRAFT_3462587 [Mycena olivaceomarginata]|nr:hypothetical protein B0H14DRAFT_3462587 [Mycena olivaceomarginata]